MVCYTAVPSVFQALHNLLSLRAQQMHDLTQRVKQAEDDIALLEARYERLRARLNGAARGAAAPPEIDPHSRAGKDAILRDFLAGPRTAKAVPDGK